MYRRRKAPHETLVDPELQRILGTFTFPGWKAFAVLEARAKFFDLKNDPMNLKHPLAGLIDTARQSSGSIDGEHRKDITEALKAAQPAPAIGLTLPSGQSGAPGTPPPKSPGV